MSSRTLINSLWIVTPNTHTFSSQVRWLSLRFHLVSRSSVDLLSVWTEWSWIVVKNYISRWSSIVKRGSNLLNSRLHNLLVRMYLLLTHLRMVHSCSISKKRLSTLAGKRSNIMTTAFSTLLCCVQKFWSQNTLNSSDEPLVQISFISLIITRRRVIRLSWSLGLYLIKHVLVTSFLMELLVEVT